MSANSPLFFERYELKYHIPPSLIEPISEFIAPYCENDRYSQKYLDNGEEGFYPISNLYLDTPNLKFLMDKEEEKKIESPFVNRLETFRQY